MLALESELQSDVEDDVGGQRVDSRLKFKREVVDTCRETYGDLLMRLVPVISICFGRRFCMEY